MLSDQGSPDGRQRNEIVDATERGLSLQIDGREEAASWSAVTGVSAGRAKLDRNSDRWVFVLASEIELGGEEHLFIVGEIEPVWLLLTAILHTSLPNIDAFDAWGTALAKASAPLELYTRTGDACW